jgi:hypothetical protein
MQQPAKFTPPEPKQASPTSFAALKGKAKQVSQQASHVEGAVRTNLQYAQAHPVEDLFDILGSGQRAVGAAIGGAEHHENPGQIAGNVLHDVFHPGDRNAQGQDATARDTEAVRALTQMPTHEAIDAWVKANVPKELQPYASGIAKGGEDFALQTLSDPLTYAGGFGGFERMVKVAGTLVHGAQAAKALAYLAHSQGALKYMPWLKDLYTFYNEGAQHIAQFTKVRPELDQVVNEEGRAARIQIENKHLTVTQQRRLQDRDAAHDDALTTARVNFYTNRMGVAPQSARRILNNVLAGTPEERLASLEQMRRKLYDRDVAVESAYHLANHNGYKPGVAAMSADEWQQFAKSQGRTLQQIMQDNKLGKAVLWATSIPRRLQQASLFLNPLPHGIKNVGTLAYLAGGPQVVPKAIVSMVKGIDASTKARLARIGLEPGYTRELQTNVWSRIPGWESASGSLQEAMGRMEEAWRASLLDVADKKFGASKNAQDEYRKAYWVNQRLGDYHNQTGFVQLFQIMGGPWVAFRLGIVPQNVMRAIAEHPERVLSIARAQEDLQRNRSVRGQSENHLELGGPVDDFAKLASNPLHYVETPASGGVLAQANQTADNLGHEPAGKAIGQTLEQFNPLGGVADVGQALAGRGMPGPNVHGNPTFQQQTLADRLLAATLATIATYYQKNPSHASQQYNRREETRIERQGF